MTDKRSLTNDELRLEAARAVKDSNYNMALEYIQKLIAPYVLLAINRDGTVRKTYGD